MANKKQTTEITKTITAHEKKKTLVVIDEIVNSNDLPEEICARYNMDYERFKYIISKKDMATKYQEALQVQSKLNTNELLNKSLKTLDDMLTGEVFEEKERWDVDANGVKTLKEFTRIKKAPDYRAVEKTLKTFAPTKFNDKIKPEQLYRIFIAFNRFLAQEMMEPELAQRIMEYQKEFILKVNEE